ncbi:MAG: 30S ribosomal protein S13 [Candidatus Omnitrophica bacterium]|nr:30S ribosomal protein S13 [Candidatus Omnitrophota bacterium]
MPRIIGVDIPKNKRIEIALTYIYGIGRTRSNRILFQAGVNPNTRAKDLTEEEITHITSVIQKEGNVEGDLRRAVTQNVKRLMDIHCYRGTRHKKGLPTRGQRTHTNARTRKGPKKIAGIKRKKTTATAAAA